MRAGELDVAVGQWRVLRWARAVAPLVARAGGSFVDAFHLADALHEAFDGLHIGKKPPPKP